MEIEFLDVVRCESRNRKTSERELLERRRRQWSVLKFANEVELLV
jgi:hypothetical protein